MIAKSPADYEAMAEAGKRRMKSYASIDVVTETLRRVLERLKDAPLGALSWDDCAA
jgi:hypothetical protein